MITLVAIATVIGAPVGIWTVVLLTKSSLRESAEARERAQQAKIADAIAPVKAELAERERDLKSMTADRDYWRTLANSRGSHD